MLSSRHRKYSDLIPVRPSGHNSRKWLPEWLFYFQPPNNHLHASVGIKERCTTHQLVSDNLVRDRLVYDLIQSSVPNRLTEDSSPLLTNMTTAEKLKYQLSRASMADSEVQYLHFVVVSQLLVLCHLCRQHSAVRETDSLLGSAMFGVVSPEKCEADKPHISYRRIGDHQMLQIEVESKASNSTSE
ncbi:hypothetical protein J6590_033135, partial [Homalodisca vitripennis]